MAVVENPDLVDAVSGDRERAHMAAYRFWIILTVVGVAAATLCFYKLGAWPWDHDEVPSLIELGVLQPTDEVRKNSQITRLPRLLPVWYETQRLFLTYLPRNEFGSRVLSALCGVLAILAAFALGWRWRGERFAVGVALVVGCNQTFIWLTQQNRFYSMAILFLLLTFAAIWWRTERRLAPALLCAILGSLAVLSHNLALVVIGIGFISAVCCFAVGAVSKAVVLRAATAAATATVIYLAYLRPIMTGWVSGGTGGTNELVSFVAQLGIPTLSLSLVGIGFFLGAKFRPSEMLWWIVALVGGLLFAGLSPWLLGRWNPRYAILFMIPFWAVAAFGVEQIAHVLPNRWARCGWYASIVLLMTPKLASHYRDGSRHDFRTASSVVARLRSGDEAVYCNWPITLRYYLDDAIEVYDWSKTRSLPDESCIMVFASNAYEPALRLSDRRCYAVADIATRRFDEQSHVIRIYQVEPRLNGSTAGGPIGRSFEDRGE
jgi:hypothetical protein